MMECELCGGRGLLAYAVDDEDRLLYMREQCEECGHAWCDYGEIDANVTIDPHPLTSGFCNGKDHNRRRRGHTDRQFDFFPEGSP